MTIIELHTADMELKGELALFPCGKTKVDIVHTANGDVLQQYDVEGTLGGSTFARKNIAALTVSAPQHGVHVMDIKFGKMISKFILPNGQDARVSLSKNAITLVVGTNTGLMMMLLILLLFDEE